MLGALNVSRSTDQLRSWTVKALLSLICNARPKVHTHDGSMIHGIASPIMSVCCGASVRGRMTGVAFAQESEISHEKVSGPVLISSIHSSFPSAYISLMSNHHEACVSEKIGNRIVIATMTTHRKRRDTFCCRYVFNRKNIMNKKMVNSPKILHNGSFFFV